MRKHFDVMLLLIIRSDEFSIRNFFSMSKNNETETAVYIAST